MIILHPAHHCCKWGEQVLLYWLVKDKGIGILAEEQDTNPGAFQDLSGLIFKTLLSQNESSNTT
jgi:hypothetical protein